MTTESLSTLAAAIVRYLQAAGVPREQLAHTAQMPPVGSLEAGTVVSPIQLQYLWQTLQSCLRTSPSFTHKVRALIAGQLTRGRVGAEAIAAQLHISRYTLYKRLKEENQTFLALREEVQREQALAYLGESQRPLVEVAELLGFSELSAFSRAFKRWTGTTPMRFRISRA